MRVVHERPPNYAEILAAFPVVAQRRGIIFSWGDRIYNPDRVEISKPLHAHEQVHGTRQGRDVESWWHRYIAEPAFRLDEEIHAHRAEYRKLCESPTVDKPLKGFRSERTFWLGELSRRLASPLYGKMISVAEAKRIIGEDQQ